VSETKKQITILGSTGSIGTQALQVIEQYSDKFEVYALTANNNVDLLIEQARKFHPEMVAIANPIHYEQLKKSLAELPIKVFAGEEAISQIAEIQSVDIILIAIVGYSALKPTMHAIQAGKRIALANKETLLVAGELIGQLVEKYHAMILPVDSEHSAIFQCLTGEGNNDIEKIILTASGGPFRTKSFKDLQKVTSAEALKHPNWTMGTKITIDSATLMNKGFEMIEAKWLFGLEPEQIEILIHPQSIIHSMVQFTDGSVKAQLSIPDMKLPILYAFTYPERYNTNFSRIDFNIISQLTFEKPDTKRFRNLLLAYEAIHQGGNMPCILNAANEVVVDTFLKNKIGFLQMSEIIEKIMSKALFIQQPTYEDYVNTDKEVRILTYELINK